MSQIYICDLLNNDDDTEYLLKDRYIQLCSSQKILGDADHRLFKEFMIDIPGYKTKKKHNRLEEYNKANEQLSQFKVPSGSLKGKPIKSLTKRDISKIRKRMNVFY